MISFDKGVLWAARVDNIGLAAGVKAGEWSFERVRGDSDAGSSTGGLSGLESRDV